MLKHLTELD
jgi:hypothetical protein